MRRNSFAIENARMRNGVTLFLLKQKQKSEEGITGSQTTGTTGKCSAKTRRRLETLHTHTSRALRLANYPSYLACYLTPSDQVHLNLSAPFRFQV